MIICRDFKEQFYNAILQAQNVVIIPYNDVDSLCATFILTRLFDADEVMYSVVPIINWEQMKVVFDDHKQCASHFVLLNCGGFRSLVELELPSNFCVYVLDARRPFHLDNVYDEQSVKIVCQESEVSDLNLPRPSEIYSDEEGGDENEDEGDTAPVSTGDRIAQRVLEQKRKAAWRENRDQVLWTYNHKSYISTPTSVFLLKIAHLMSKTSASATWAAAVGLSSFQLDHSISTTTYSTICIESMKPHLRPFALNGTNKSDPTLRVTFEKELTIPLYRHWTLYESIKYDIFFICACRLWTQQGPGKLRNVYASLGIPLQECQNSFSELNSKRRKEITDKLNDYMKTNFGTFFSHKGYSQWFSSIDFARAMALELQFSDPIKSHTELFANALRFLRDFVDKDGGSSDAMKNILEHYKSALLSLTQLAYDCVLQRKFIQTPSFIGLTIAQHCTELDYFRSSHCLNIFTYIALRVFHGTKRTDRRLMKPMFIAVLNPTELPENLQSADTPYYLCSGCMPLGDILSDPERKTFIPRVMEELAQDDSLHTIYDNIDPNVILVREDSYAEFFSRLDTRLPAVS